MINEKINELVEIKEKKEDIKFKKGSGVYLFLLYNSFDICDGCL